MTIFSLAQLLKHGRCCVVLGQAWESSYLIKQISQLKRPTCTHVGDHRCIQVEHAATMSTCMCKGTASHSNLQLAGEPLLCIYEWSSLWCMYKLCSMVPNEWSSLSCMHSAYLKANITTVHSAVCNSQPALSHGCQTHRHWCLLFHFYGSYSECILHALESRDYVLLCGPKVL